ncbi:MAG: Flp family type IVb pilin [Oscillochloridaceae bacterium umkhey_bin13]
MRRPLALLSHHAATLRRQLTVWMFAVRYPQPGQGLVEYGLILVLIMVVCVGILTLTGNTISEVWYEKLYKAFPGT